MPLFQPTQRQFVDQILRELSRRNVPGKFDEATNCIHLSNGLRLYLSNFYQEYSRAALWNRGKVVDRYLGILNSVSPDVPETLDQVRGLLMPKVRERAYTELIRLRSRAEGRSAVEIEQRTFADGHLTLEVVIDTAQYTKSIQPQSLVDWGLTFDDALGIANENLKKRSTTGGFEVLQPGLYRSTWRDTFDASRIHLSDFMSMLEVKGRYVAMVPNRDVLIVTGENDEDGLAAMAKIAAEVLNQPRPMTGLAFRLDSGWVPFLPPDGHPASKALKELHVQTMGQVYAEQKAVMDHINEKDNVDVFVASYTGIGLPNGMSSYSTWGEGSDALLPRTDLLAFGAVQQDGERKLLGMARWENVMRVAPSLLEPQGMYPERYRTLGFPTPDQFAEIGFEELQKK